MQQLSKGALSMFTALQMADPSLKLIDSAKKPQPQEWPYNVNLGINMF